MTSQPKNLTIPLVLTPNSILNQKIDNPFGHFESLKVEDQINNHSQFQNHHQGEFSQKLKPGEFDAVVEQSNPNLLHNLDNNQTDSGTSNQSWQQLQKKSLKEELNKNNKENSEQKISDKPVYEPSNMNFSKLQQAEENLSKGCFSTASTKSTLLSFIIQNPIFSSMQTAFSLPTQNLESIHSNMNHQKNGKLAQSEKLVKPKQSRSIKKQNQNIKEKIHQDTQQKCQFSNRGKLSVRKELAAKRQKLQDKFQKEREKQDQISKNSSIRNQILSNDSNSKDNNDAANPPNGLQTHSENPNYVLELDNMNLEAHNIQLLDSQSQYSNNLMTDSISMSDPNFE